MSQSPEQQIVEHVLDAIADQKLRAGTKLGEQSLSEIFSCNRTQVRRALATLTGYHVVEHLPNRGAYVATPSEADARHVFEARRAIEMTICKNVVQFANPADHARLRANLAQEHEANGAGNRALAIRLSRQFHLILAEVGRNPVLSQYLEELTMRTSLVLGLYGSDQRSLCAVDEHAGILDAIERRDEAAVCREIEAHLRHIEAAVDFAGAPKPRGALSSLLGPIVIPT
ncbi:MAG: GntR family transcriptional regulator [Rhodobacteraceae bacterium]|nr:GntR family transcriptional regulator [Paracoccaceae bacterium]